MAKQSKNLPRHLDSDWISDPGKHRFSRIQRIMHGTDTRQENELKDIPIPEDIPQPNMSTVFGLDKDGKWKIIGKKCFDCGKAMSRPEVIEKHPLICDHAIKINKEQENELMPIQRVMKNGEVYYRYGTHGKLYKDKKDAEKQAQAIHASGYKEPKKVNK